MSVKSDFSMCDRRTVLSKLILFFLCSLFFPFHGILCCDPVIWADFDECERVPRPCAHQCINTPGSFKCVCPAGQHLLGDGKSCAGLERLPNYERIYNYAQFPNVGYYNQQQFSQTSQYRPRVGSGSLYRAPFSRTGRSIRKTCPEGYEAKHGNCIGKHYPL